jgi:DNA-binding NarL/FixJ family response regulator
MISERTSEALDTLSERAFGAVISDMGRRGGPREGYAFLDALRARGDETPLFFYAGSSDPKHKRETREHGGQGSTNDGQELFEMVTRVIFGSQPARRVSSVNLRQP